MLNLITGVEYHKTYDISRTMIQVLPLHFTLQKLIQKDSLKVNGKRIIAMELFQA